MRKLYLLFIFLNILFVGNAYAVTYNAEYMKDINVSTPGGTEAVSSMDNAAREIKRVQSYQYGLVTKTADYTLTGSETVCLGSGTINITLPLASTVASSSITKYYEITNTGSSGTVTVIGTIDGVGTRTLSKYDSLTVFSDGSSWYEKKATANIAGTFTSFNATSAVITTATITTLSASTGTFTSTLGVSGVSGLVDSDIPDNATLTNITQITNRSHTNLSDIGTNAHTDIDTHIADTSDPHGASLTQTNLTNTTGTITTLYNTTGNITNLLTTTGTVTTLNSTTGNITNLVTTTGTITTLNSTTGNITNQVTTTGTITTLYSTTGNITTGNITNQVTTTGTITTLNSTTGNITNLVTTTGTITTLNSTTGNVTTGNITNLVTTTGTITTLTGSTGTLTGALGASAFYANGALMPSAALTEWQADSKTGTGSVRISQGGGMTITSTYNNNGIGTITFATTGTASAGGWNDTGTTVVQETSSDIIKIDNVSIYAGTGSLSGLASPFIPQTNGTASGTQITNASIISGTSSLSGIASPYIAQTNGTGTGLTLNTTTITTGTITTLTGSTGTFTGGFRASTFYGDGSQLSGIDTSGTNTFSLIQLTPTSATPTVFTNGQIYLFSGTITNPGSETVLYLSCNNPGTSTFIDSSVNGYAVTANGNAIGTTTAKFGSGGAWFDGNGDTLTLADNANWRWDATNYTIRFWIYPITFTGSDMFPILEHATDGSNFWWLKYDQTGAAAPGKLNFRCDQPGNIFNIVSNTAFVAGTWTHAQICKAGQNYYMFVNGNLTGSATTATVMNDFTGLYTLGDSLNSNQDLNAIIDDYEVIRGVALNIGTFTAPVAPGGYDVSFTYKDYHARYIDPANGNTIFQISTTGTVTTEKSYIFCNATTTVFGAGTSTDPAGTTTLYAGYAPAGKGSWYCDGYITASEVKTKVGIYYDPTIDAQKYYYSILSKAMPPEWQRVDARKPKYTKQEIEDKAKQSYKSNLHNNWNQQNKNNDKYKTIKDDGAGSTTVLVNTKLMESDFEKYAEIQWASEPNQLKIIKGQEWALMGDGMKRIGYVADDPNTPAEFKTPDGSGLSNDNMIGGMQMAFYEATRKINLLELTVGSLTVEIEKLKNP